MNDVNTDLIKIADTRSKAMNTIFISAMKELIDRKLEELSRSLAVKAGTGPMSGFGMFYDAPLSSAQQGHIDALKRCIKDLMSSNNDLQDVKAIYSAIEGTFALIQGIRKTHQATESKSETIDCLNFLKNKVKEFYQKMSTFAGPHQLLNKSFDNSPYSIFGYYVALYLGDELFFPQTDNGDKIREDKETKVKERLIMLSQLLKSKTCEEDELEKTLKVIDDLLNDNRNVCGKWGVPVTVPVGVYGINPVLPAGTTGPGLGRLEQLITLAKVTIETRINPINTKAAEAATALAFADFGKSSMSFSHTSTTGPHAAASLNGEDDCSDDGDEPAAPPPHVVKNEKVTPPAPKPAPAGGRQPSAVLAISTLFSPAGQDPNQTPVSPGSSEGEFPDPG